MTRFKVSKEEIEKIASEIHGKFAWVNLGYESFTLEGVPEATTGEDDGEVIAEGLARLYAPKTSGECCASKLLAFECELRKLAKEHEDCPCHSVTEKKCKGIGCSLPCPNHVPVTAKEGECEHGYILGWCHFCPSEKKCCETIAWGRKVHKADCPLRPSRDIEPIHHDSLEFLERQLTNYVHPIYYPSKQTVERIVDKINELVRALNQKL